MLVTVITPSYNQAAYLPRTIESVIWQTYCDIEYIIFDACSTDGTSAILDAYENHPRVTRIVREKDDGQADAINKGFRGARGEIVGWINSDDMLPPDIVERSVKAFRQDSDVGLTYCDIEHIDHTGNSIKLSTAHPHYDFNYLLNSCYDVFQPGSFYRKSVVESVGYLDESLKYCMDLDIWLKILARSRSCYLPGRPSSFRWHEATKTAIGKTAFLREILQILRRHGTTWHRPNIRRLYWYWFKSFINRQVSA
jgi:glycosyltransferase involved in cell wall biosynthesis